MRSFLITSFFVTSAFFSYSQIHIPVLENSVNDISNFNLAVTFPLLKKSEIIIMFRSHSAWGKGMYKIINFEVDNKWHANVLKDSSMDISIASYNQLKEITMPQDSIKRIWDTFIDNDIFKLQNEDPDDTTCNISLADAPYYEISILTATKYKLITYYSPAIFEEQCPGNLNRQKMIRAISAFSNSKIFKQHW